MIRVCMRDYGFWFSMMMTTFSKATVFFFLDVKRRRIGDGDGTDPDDDGW